MRPWGLLDRFQHPWKLLPHQMRGHSQYHLHPQGLRVSWTSDQFDVPTNSQAAVEFGGRQNNGCPGSQQVAYPGFPNERKSCNRCVDALVLGVHYRQHKARVEIGTRQLHNHTSIPDQLNRERNRWLSAYEPACETRALPVPQRRDVVSLYVPTPTDTFSKTVYH